MKIKIEIDENVADTELVIRCSQLNDEVVAMQKALSEVFDQKKQLVFYKAEKEYYIPPKEILFFETDGNGISAHTIDNVFHVKYKLYELEDILPGCFMRVSKSTILNLNEVYAVTKNMTAASVIEFRGTHKQVFVSRNYYKALISRLDEKR